jgi:hypothetical protein
MAFASNIAAMNAARKILIAQGINSAALKEYFSFEKHDGEWHALQSQPFPAARDPLASILDDRAGIFAFPKASEALSAALTASQAESSAYEESGDEFFSQQAAEAERIANSQQSGSTVNGKEWIRISSVIKPTKFVWHVADEMNEAAAAAGKPAPTRKEVQDECVRRGVASGTARTQYQAWKKARDESAANAVHAAELSARFNQK